RPMTDRATLLRLALALYVAGQAVAFFALGFQLVRAEVPNTPAAKPCTIQPWDHDDPATAAAYCVAVLGGPAAADLVSAAPYLDPELVQRDWRVATRVLGLIKPGPLAEIHTRRAADAAHALLSDEGYWRAVRAITRALLQHRELDTRHLDALIQ